MKSMTILRIGVCVCLSLLLGGATFAQTTGTIRGSVKDPSGAVVPGANLRATLQGTDTTRTASSDADGDFEFPELAVGHYTVTVEATGFKKFNVKDIEVSLGHVTAVNAALQVGESAQTVTVESEAAQVETTSTQMGAVVNDIAIRQLPLNKRDTYQLLQLQPGVQSQLGANLFYGSDQAGVVSVNGGRGRSNNYMVNGGDGNDIFVNLPAIQPSPDAIEEFRVLTNTFDAEYGRNSGSVVNVVTKSGTNEIHGDFYDFFRNKVLDARNPFDSTVADWKQNQFGATLGAPIKKDRTFIFGSYEGNRQIEGQSSGNVFVPTSQEAAGNFSAAGSTFTGTLSNAFFAGIIGARTTGNTGQNCDSAARKEQAAAGLPPTGVTNAAGGLFQNIFPNNKIPIECFDPVALDLYNQFVAPLPNSGSGTVSLNPGEHDRGDQFTIRFDHKISATQQFSAYYYFTDNSKTEPFSFFQAAGANVPGFGALFATRVQQWNLSHTWTIGSSAVNEFRFSYFREGQGKLDHPAFVSSDGTAHSACKTVSAAFCFSDPANLAAGITTRLPGHAGVPFISVSGGFVIGNNFEGELPQVGNTFQWMDNYTKIIGKHSFKFGGDVHRQRFDQFLFFETTGFFTFQSNQASPSGNDVGFSDAYPNYFLGQPTSYGQGAAQAEDLRNTQLFVFAQDSWKLRPSVTLNYGLRWELNTNYYDLGNRLQTFRPGQADKLYPCLLNPAQPSSAALIAAFGSAKCGPNDPGNAVFPLGELVPGDPGVPRGLTQTYYRSFAPRIGLAWSPGWTGGWLSKLTGGPGKSSVRMGWGLFYNPIEQLVLEQFSAEPPFGGSTLLSGTLFNTPFEFQSGGQAPNPFVGVIQQTPKTPCFNPSGPTGCVDWSLFRPLLLFGEFQPHMRSQYSVQYNFNIERQLGKDMIFQIGYVGTQAHRLLASHELNGGNARTCLDLNAISTFYTNAGNSALASAYSCGPFFADSPFSLPAGTIPPGFTLHLPYGSIPSVTGSAANPSPAITLVGLRPFSSPFCHPTTGVGCPPDSIPVFGSIFAQDTIGNSNYNSLQLLLERHFSKGLQFQAAYTFSKSIDDSSSFESILNPLNFRKTRSLSLFDATHRFVFSPYWELPIAKHQGLTGKLINGWAVSGIITYQTGFPIRIDSSNDIELENSFDFEPIGVPQLSGPVHFLNPKTHGGQLFDTSVFNDAAPGTFGNAPRSLCCGPAISQTDLSFQKTTSITEKTRLEFRADFFNIWNHTQFLNPDGNFSNLGSTFGFVTKARDPRLIQFGLKFSF